MFNTNRLAKFLETGEMPLATALDEAIANYKPTDLESHDKRFHPEGYKEGDACKYREGMAKGDKTDEGLGGDKEQAKPQDDDMPTGTIVTIKDSHLRYGGERGEIVGNHKYGYKVKLVDRQDKPIVELQANQVAEKV